MASTDFTFSGTPSSSSSSSSSSPSSSAHYTAIFQKAQELVVTCQYELAEKFLRRVLEQNPDFTPALDELASLLIDNGSNEEAASLLRKSIKLRPDGDLETGDEGYFKYLTLAEILEGKAALSCYRRGVDLLRQAAERTVDESEKESLKKRAAEAYASASELYLTDLCMEPDAEECCQNLFEQALLLDPENIDALQTAASCRLSQCRADDAFDFLSKSYGNWSEKDPSGEDYPSYPFRIATAKLFMELKKPETAITILDQLLLEDEEVTEVWYLLVLSHEMANDLDSCAEAVANGIQQVKTSDDIDPRDREQWLAKFNEYAKKLESVGVSLPDLQDADPIPLADDDEDADDANDDE